MVSEHGIIGGKEELQTLENGTVYVVYGHYDEKMTVINPETGDEFQVYITTSNDITNKLNKKGIFSNTEVN